MAKIFFKISFYILLAAIAYAFIQTYLPGVAYSYYERLANEHAPKPAGPQTPQQACYAECASKRLPLWVCEAQYSCNTIQ